MHSLFELKYKSEQPDYKIFVLEQQKYGGPKHANWDIMDYFYTSGFK